MYLILTHQHFLSFLFCFSFCLSLLMSFTSHWVQQRIKNNLAGISSGSSYITKEKDFRLSSQLCFHKEEVCVSFYKTMQTFNEPLWHKFEFCLIILPLFFQEKKIHIIFIPINVLQWFTHICYFRWILKIWWKPPNIIQNNFSSSK